jgi:hypothetical protein
MNANTRKQDPYLSIKVEGTTVKPGRMHLDDFMHLMKDVRASVVALARGLYTAGEPTQRRRPPADLSEAIALDIVDFTHGSPAAVAHFERSVLGQENFPENDLGDEAYTSWVTGMAIVTSDQVAIPNGFDKQVLVKARDLGKLFDKGIETIQFRLNHRQVPIVYTYNHAGYVRVRQRIDGPQELTTTIEGRLLMADFNEAGRRFRIYPSVGHPVYCDFDATMADEVQENIRKFVRVTGTGLSDSPEELRRIRVEDIEPIEEPEEGENVQRQMPAPGEFWSDATVEELALVQGVEPVIELSELLGGWPGDIDDGFEDEIEKIRAAESSGEYGK